MLCLADILDENIKTYVIVDSTLKEKIIELINMLSEKLTFNNTEKELFNIVESLVENSINIPLNVLIFPGKLSDIINYENITKDVSHVFSEELSDNYIKQILDTGVIPNSILWFEEQVDSETMINLSKFYLEMITV
jgi:hypothetical protein